MLDRRATLASTDQYATVRQRLEVAARKGSSVRDQQYFNIQAYYRVTKCKLNGKLYEAGEGITFSFGDTTENIEVREDTEDWTLYNATVKADLSHDIWISFSATTKRSMTYVVDLDAVSVTGLEYIPFEG